MADFRQQISPTSDPNYLRQSKEPDRIRPLEQVPIPANTLTDNSAGVLLQGLGQTLDLGVGITDQAIKRNLKDDANALIDPIRNAAGADTPAGEVSAIAGTGAKGRARLASSGGLFGSPDGGAGSNSYAPEDASRDYSQFGLPSVITGGTDKDLPPQASTELRRVSRMNAAYLQGELSDSYYNAQLVSVTKELKARYPGYRDEVDAAVSGITGIQPANALRKSLLSDLNANAAARMQQGTDQEKQIYQNRDNITSVAPDFFTNRGKYAGQEQRVLAQSYQLSAQREEVKASAARLSLDSSNAGGVAADMGSFRVRTAVNLINNVTDPDGKTVNQKFNEIMNRPGGATPEEIGSLSGTLERMKSQVSQAIMQDFSQPMADGKTINSHLGGDPGKIKGIVDNSVAPIDAMLSAVKNGDFRRTKIMMDSLSLSQNTEAQRQINASASIKFVAGLSKAGGEQLAGQIFQNTSLLPQLQKELAQGKLLDVMRADTQTPVVGISNQLSDMGKAGAPVNGQALRAVVEGNKRLIENRTFGDGVSANAVKNLFDQKFFAELAEPERLKTMQYMASPEMTSRISELDKANPGLMKQYSDWTKYAFQTVFRGGISNAKDAIDDPRFTPRYDDKSGQIVLDPKPGMANKGMLGNISQVGNGYVDQVNQGLRIVQGVFKAQGYDVNEATLSLIQDMGIDLNAKPTAQNGILHSVGTTIRGMFMGPEAPAGAPTAPAGKGKLSMDSGATPLHDTIGQAESGGDYNSVFGFKKGTTRNLAELTVNEVMALQKANTDAGQPSSAIGKYQFLRKTLASLVKEGAISPDDHLTPDVQDTLATKLMERRGLNDYRAGKIPKSQFLQNLSQEWAGLPSNNGLSFYAGDGLNAATVSLPTVLASIEKL